MTLEHEGALTALALCSTRRLIFAGSEFNKITVWNVDTFSQETVLIGHTRSILALTVQETTLRLFSSSADGTVRIWTPKMDCVHTITLSSRALHLSSISSTRVGIACQNGQLQIWDNTSSSLESVSAHEGYVYITRPHSEEVFFTGGSDAVIKRWQLSPLKCTQILRGHTGSVLALWSSSEVLFSAGKDASIRCWDIESGHLRAILPGHSQAILSLCAMDDSLCSASMDGTVRLWDLNSLLPTHVLPAFSQPVIALQADSPWLFTAALNGTLHAWDVQSSSSPPATDSLSVSTHGNQSPIHSRAQYWFQTSTSLTADRSMFHLLHEFVAIPSVSRNPECREDCWKAAKFVKCLLEQLGTEVKLASSNNYNPIVIGRLGSDPSRKTVLICGHYDVQPAHPENGWKSPPFQLTGRDGFLYGRGASDDKGPILCILFAIRDLLQNGQDVPNFVFVIQGEGENRSLGFQDFVKKEIAQDKIDLIFISNNYWLDDNVPCLTYGMRGCLEMEIKIEGPSVDAHAGVDGGVLCEPMHDLTRLLAHVVPTRNSPIFEILQQEVRPATDAERKVYHDISFDVEKYKAGLGTTQLFQEKKGSSRDEETSLSDCILMSRWRMPSLSITNIITPIDNPSIIPHLTTARVSVRTVPDQVRDLFFSFIFFCI